MPSALPSGAAPQSPAEAPVRVMIVDDSVVVRGLIARWLNDHPGTAVVSSQPNGAAALRELDRACPDVVLLDVEMPEMDGITALPLMLERRPDLVVIMASGLTQRNAEISLRALALGAKDYVPKPDGNHLITSSVEFRRSLIERITVLGGTARGQHRVGRLEPGGVSFADAAQLPATIPLRPFSKVAPRVLAIGASTGGPRALHALFATLGSAVAAIPVLVTQHMPPGFTAILADQLGRVSGRPAREGRCGDILKPGCLYVAPGGKHMLVEALGEPATIAISDRPPINFCKPAVDPLFESVARRFGAASLAVVLTGMGADGARGAARIADAGGSVIAQDAATSVVWGMPGTAAHLGACAAVLPIEDIGPKVTAMLEGGP